MTMASRLHPGAAASCGWRQGIAARRPTSSRATRCRCAHSGRHHRPQRGDEGRQGWQDRPVAGTYVQLVGRDAGYAQLRLAPAKLRMVGRVHGDGRCGVQPGSEEYQTRQGWSQALAGQASAVRGVAMNPVDHPHGGGEGRTSGGRHPVPRGASRPRASGRGTTRRATSMIVSVRRKK